jgi:hypothetical protein
MSTTSPSNQRRFSLKNLNPFVESAPALTSEPAPNLPSAANPEPTTTPAPPDLISLADLEPQPPDWLWPCRLAAGTLALLSGHPGAGKTWLGLSFAAALSNGRAPYTGDSLPPCTTLYVSTEHDGAQIVHPRFAALHGDPARLVVLRTAAAQSKTQTNPAQLLHQLDQALNRTQARLLILDPLETFFGPAADPDRHPEDLDTLRHLAEHHHCCILLLHHLRKPPLGRPARTRSVASFSTALRTEFLAGASPDAPNQFALLHTRSNLSPRMPALAYTITADGLRFNGISQLTPHDILTDRPTGAGLPQRKFAGAWLRNQLADGSLKQSTLESNALRDGVSLATLKRARFDLGVISRKDGTTGSWFWTLPATPTNTEIINAKI